MSGNRTAIDNAIVGPPIGGSSEPTFAGVPSFMRRRFTKDLSGADVAILGGSSLNRVGRGFNHKLNILVSAGSAYFLMHA